jgi:hypothetical protein
MAAVSEEGRTHLFAYLLEVYIHKVLIINIY